MSGLILGAVAVVVLALASLPPDLRMDHDAAVRYLLFLVVLGVHREGESK